MVAYREGVLSKFSIGKGSFSRKNWKERWFVVDEDGIKYFGKRHEGTPKGVILWTHVMEILPAVDARIHPNATDPHAIYFGAQFWEGADDKRKQYTLLLRTGSAGERAEWVDTMRLAKEIVEKLSSRRLFQEIREEEDLMDEHDLDAFEQSFHDHVNGGADSQASSPRTPGLQPRPFDADAVQPRAAPPKDTKKKSKTAPPATSALTMLKSLVSKNKIRYVDTKYNLDLVYVTPQLIAMGFPAEGREAFYRNKQEEVEAFLDERHGSAYKVYNLCAERDYTRGEVFGGRWERHPFEDHNPPPLSLFPPLLRNIHNFLSTSASSTAAIHCKAGKGRTGTVICAYLACYRDIPPDVALTLFGNQRATDGKGVTIPSQIRYVHYATRLMKADGDLEVPRLRLQALTFHRLLSGKHSSLNAGTVYFQVTRRHADGEVQQHCDMHTPGASPTGRRASTAADRRHSGLSSNPHTPVITDGSASFRAASFEQAAGSLPSSPRTGMLGTNGSGAGGKRDVKKDKFEVVYDSRHDMSLKVFVNTGSGVVQVPRTAERTAGFPRSGSHLTHALLGALPGRGGKAPGPILDENGSKSPSFLDPMRPHLPGTGGRVSPAPTGDASHLSLHTHDSPAAPSPSHSVGGDPLPSPSQLPPLPEGACRFDLSTSGQLSPDILQGDVRIVFYEESGFRLKSDAKLFQVWFHTAYVDEGRSVFAKKELDGLHKDKDGTLFDNSFSLTLEYTKLPPAPVPARDLANLNLTVPSLGSPPSHEPLQSPLTSASGSPTSFA